jgi:molybdopterin molybdotransferase
MISVLARADCLVIRAPHAPAAKAGDWVEIIPMTGL